MEREERVAVHVVELALVHGRGARGERRDGVTHVQTEELGAQSGGGKGGREVRSARVQVVCAVDTVRVRSEDGS